METSQIIDALRRITARGGVGEVHFAGKETPPPMLAFAVHFPRLTVVVDGEYQTFMEKDKEIRRLIMKPGDTLLAPPNCWDKPDMRQHSTTLHLLFGKQHTGISLVTSDLAVRARKVPLDHTLAGPEQKILDAIFEMRNNNRYSCYNHLITALLDCYTVRLESLGSPNSSKPSMLFQDICTFIQENFQQQLTRSDVAGRFDISPNHLSRLFNRNGYMKFCDYLNYVRINRAKFLLKSYDLSLYQIARRCGYSDTGYFCRVFKKVTKKTPKQYQAQMV
ncbi:MAG: helix-turn-helix transcriptional regulator [Phycisphaerae bacterium]